MRRTAKGVVEGQSRKLGVHTGLQVAARMGVRDDRKDELSGLVCPIRECP